MKKLAIGKAGIGLTSLSEPSALSIFSAGRAGGVSSVALARVFNVARTLSSNPENLDVLGR